MQLRGESRDLKPLLGHSSRLCPLFTAGTQGTMIRKKLFWDTLVLHGGSPMGGSAGIVPVDCRVADLADTIKSLRCV